MERTAMMIKRLTTARLIKLTGGTLLAEYLLTSVHHVDEGLGLVFGFSLSSLLAPLTFGIPLLITLGLLYLYQQTHKRFMLVVLSITILLWWVAGIGLFDGFYNHTLSILLFLARVPPQMMRLIFPTYVPLTSAGTSLVPCDASPFRFCAVTPATVLFEASGILSFVAACFLAFVVSRLIRAQWSEQDAEDERLPRTVMVAVILGLAASFGALPLLGAFMSTGRLIFLLAVLPVLLISILALVVALVWLNRRSANQLHPHIAAP